MPCGRRKRIGTNTRVLFCFLCFYLCTPKLLLPRRVPVGMAPPPSTPLPPGSDDERLSPDIDPIPVAVAPGILRHLWDAPEKRPRA